MTFPAGARFPMRLLASIPEPLRAASYKVTARQMYGDEELGASRGCWLLPVLAASHVAAPKRPSTLVMQTPLPTAHRERVPAHVS